RMELHVTHQVEALRDMLDVRQNLMLRRVALRPVPFLLQVVVERVRVLEALDDTSRARILVPEPRTADAAASLESARLEAEAPHAMDGIEAGKAGADDRDIELDRFLGGVSLAHCGLPSCVMRVGAV